MLLRISKSSESSFHTFLDRDVMSRDQCCVGRSCDVSRDVSCDLSGD